MLAIYQTNPQRGLKPSEELRVHVRQISMLKNPTAKRAGKPNLCGKVSSDEIRRSGIFEIIAFTSLLT